MKHLYIIVIALVFVACKEATTDSDKETEKSDPTVQMTDEERLIRHIESNLQIPATENYSYKVYKEDLNGDDSLDYIVTVNRLNKAMEEAIQSGNVAKRAELGYIGNFNIIFYMDGAKKSISPPLPIPSSPHAELQVNFENIRSEAYKDITVDFRIRNSCFRRFYTVVRDLPMEVFEAKIYDGLGTPEAEAYTVKYGPGSYSLAKDILIYKGELDNVEISDPLEVYTLVPKIKETDILVRQWFFNGNQMQYYTKKD